MEEFKRAEKIRPGESEQSRTQIVEGRHFDYLIIFYLVFSPESEDK